MEFLKTFGGNTISKLNKRLIDYYIKGLSAEVRQLHIFPALENIVRVKDLLEYPKGYPRYKRMGLNDQQIEKLLTNYSQHFEEVNQIMINNGREPLFENPCDTYECAHRYIELLRKDITEEELLEIMVCSWDDYIPETY